ncbi:manganese efflux pump MntP family protein [uncultured Parasphingorhabdus sp.]|uniref:manganese efflux pump MntP n=1 Tax=uncultured Parasphingorhabdus sp. TaxID=2709694 RepID=UPI0030DC835C|tara:strand:+ start:1996 stop:2544 length:549 start_codon:yes stop_codon:yes gene_type:complete
MENLFLIVALAAGLAMDAFAVAVAQGAAGHNSMFHATRTGMAFGVAQGIMPFLGWALGIVFVSHISAYDHWIALILLSGLGMKMLWEARDGNGNDSAPSLSGWALGAAAIATSIDAFAAGITLPALALPVLLTCIAIGIITALLSSLGVMIGGMASSRIGKYAEVAGGIILIALGIKIFVEH